MSSAIPMRGLRMSDDLYFKLKFIAKIENRSYNQEAVYLLQKAVSEYEAKHGKIEIDEDEICNLRNEKG